MAGGGFISDTGVVRCELRYVQAAAMDEPMEKKAVGEKGGRDC